jgi:hypothetical protein
MTAHPVRVSHWRGFCGECQWTGEAVITQDEAALEADQHNFDVHDIDRRTPLVGPW